MSRTRTALARLLLVAVAASCGEREANPYGLTLDLQPTIAALGGDDDEADAAYDFLASLGTHAAPALVAALTREPTPVRIQTIELLGSLTAPPLDPLLAAATDADHRIREAALEALALIDDPRVTDAVEAALDDDVIDVRRAAAAACARACRSERATERLVAFALDPADFALAERARGALRDHLAAGRAETRAAITRLATARIDAAESPGSVLRAGLLLSETKSTGAVPALVASANEPSLLMVLRVHAIAALANIDDPSSVEGLAPFVTGKEPLVITQAACAALTRLADKETAGAADALARCPGRRPSRTSQP